MDGIHLLGEWYGCPADTPYMIDAQALRTACLDAVAAAGLTSVGDRFHQFEPQGVTGAVILAESHLAIHTWPEMGSVTLDVYVCNFTTDNTGEGAGAVPRARDAAEARALARAGDPSRRRARSRRSTTSTRRRPARDRVRRKLRGSADG